MRADTTQRLRRHSGGGCTWLGRASKRFIAPSAMSADGVDAAGDSSSDWEDEPLRAKRSRALAAADEQSSDSDLSDGSDAEEDDGFGEEPSVSSTFSATLRPGCAPNRLRSNAACLWSAARGSARLPPPPAKATLPPAAAAAACSLFRSAPTTSRMRS